MHLTASIQPPDDVLDHLASAMGEEFAETHQVNWEHRSRWRVRLANFGIVVRGDAITLADLLTERIAEFGAPTLRLEEIRPLPLDGDDSVWVGVGGDGEIPAQIAQAIPRWTHQVGFVPDRRAYYAGIRLGRVTPATTVEYLEALATRLGGYEGPAWTSTEVLITSEKPGGPNHPPRFEVFQTAPFAERAASDAEPDAASDAEPDAASDAEPDAASDAEPAAEDHSA